MGPLNDVKTKLIAAIDNTKTLPQEELNQIFARARMLLDDATLLLSSICTYPQTTFIAISARVLNGEDANKAFYKRPALLADEPFVKSSKDVSRDRFLCDAMDLQAAMLSENIEAQHRILTQHNLTRNIFEEIIDSWVNECGRYTYHCEAAVNATPLQRFNHEQEIVRVEHRLGATKPHFFYGAIRYLKRIREALRSMYAKVLEAYTRIVLQSAKRTAGSIAQESDSFQHGSIGLMRAISLYDHCSYMRFSNFAPWWILQAILFQLKDEANTVRIPLNIWQQHSKIEKSRIPLEAKYGPLSHEELADKLGITTRSIAAIYMSIRAAHPESIDAPTMGTKTSSGSKKTIGTRKGSPAPDSHPGVLSELFDTRAEDITGIMDASARTQLPLEALNYRERLVVGLSYGLLDQIPEKPQTTEDQRAYEVLVEKYRQKTAHRFR